MLDVNNPYNGKLIKQIEINTTADVEQALARAHALFEDRSAWLPAYQRIEILERAAQIMTDRVDELTKIAAEEGGKPYVDSKVEVLRAIKNLRLIAWRLHSANRLALCHRSARLIIL